MPDTRRPSVGRIVHYVHYGTSGSEIPQMCRAAIVTEVLDESSPLGTVGLAVFNPTGVQFHPAAFDPSEFPSGGTWHWPEVS